VWEIINIQGKYDAIVACITAYEEFVIVTKVPYL
jgi:hypothetical protein